MIKINSVDYNKCTRCLVCKLSCPKQAITFNSQYHNFMYPTIDSNKCVDCGLCYNICHLNASKTVNCYEQKCFSFWKENTDSLFSTSGGAFFSIAKAFLKSGGIVFASSWNTDLSLSMKQIRSENELILSLKSKYIESDISGALPQIKECLYKNNQVLICACPCQIAAIKQYVGNKLQSNLFCIDLVCHGVSCNKSFLDYLSFIRDKIGFVKSIDFRSKKNGWKNKKGTFVEIVGEKKTIVEKASHNYFMKLFYSGISYRESCYRCNYSTHNRVGDITLGDFFEIDSVINNPIASKNGISLVLVNTKKGDLLLKSLEGESNHLEKQNIRIPFENNESLSRPYPKPKNVDIFYGLCDSRGFAYACKKCLKTPLKHKLAVLIGIDRIKKIKKTY